MSCGHVLCEIIGGACSLVTRRSHGCRRNPATANAPAPEVIAEVRDLLAAIDPDRRSEAVRAAAVRLAALARREALEDRNLVAAFRDDEPDLAPLLERLCRRA